jgi:hypothetical protein
VLVSAVAALVAASPVSAAEGSAQLISISGKVLVNQGTGFVPPSPGMMLDTGQKVFVGHEASAVITYKADDCQVTVPGNRVVTIEVLSPCQNKSVQIQPAADLPEQAQAYAPAFPWPLLIIPPVIACAILCFNDDDDDVSRENNND